MASRVLLTHRDSYSMRLPDIVPSVCEKLGAPMPSPTRPKPQPLQPGATAARSRSAQARRPLARVLTDDPLATARPPRPPPALARAATDTAVPSLRRSLSAASLAASAAPSIAAVRPTLERARRREVDLAAVARTTEARRARHREVQQQLHDAIATLQRPNARAAVGELVAAADRRQAESSVRARKPPHPRRRPPADAVQVLATPKAPRFRPLAPPEPPGRALEPEAVPPSSAPRVPSSTAKPVPARQASVLDSLRRPSASQMNSGCDSTPSRRRGVVRSISSTLPAARRAGDLGELDALSSSPPLPPPRLPPNTSMGAPRKRPLDVGSGNLMTPTKKRSGLGLAAETKGTDECVRGTPIKQDTASYQMRSHAREVGGVKDTPVKTAPTRE